MTRILRGVVVVVALAGLAACHRKTDDINRNQQKYDVVTESAGGTVSSTVVAPGETATSQATNTSTMTSTSLDTTTAFTVGGVTAATTAAPNDGSLAGTLPQIAGAQPGSRTPPARTSDRPRARSGRPPLETTDRAETTTGDTRMTEPQMDRSKRPSDPPQQPAPPADPDAARPPATDTDTSKPPATDTTSTVPPQR